MQESSSSRAAPCRSCGGHPAEPPRPQLEALAAPVAGLSRKPQPIEATTARLKIGQVDLSHPIPEGAVEVSFDLRLSAGKTRLETWFTDEQTGRSRGAYYVHVKRVP